MGSSVLVIVGRGAAGRARSWWWTCDDGRAHGGVLSSIMWHLTIGLAKPMHWTLFWRWVHGRRWRWLLDRMHAARGEGVLERLFSRLAVGVASNFRWCGYMWDHGSPLQQSCRRSDTCRGDAAFVLIFVFVLSGFVDEKKVVCIDVEVGSLNLYSKKRK
jgi:hypothetical protein